MAPKLRPLRLPQLVEHRRKMEAAQSTMDYGYDLYYQSAWEEPATDAVTPVTPTFPPRTHSRYPSSASSFNLDTPATPEYNSSPAQVSQKAGKRSLPDVQEESTEYRDEYDSWGREEYTGLYDCLCAEPCLHGSHDMVERSTGFYSRNRAGSYDKSLSETDFDRLFKKHQGATDSTLSGITQRIGSKFTGIARWRNSKRISATQSPVSDFGFDQRTRFSRPPSSRSSSRSASGRQHLDRSAEPPMPPTPALSFYESSDSIALSASHDDEKNVISLDTSSIERERALTNTPLLPPFVIELAAASPVLQPSPMGSPMGSPQLGSPAVLEARTPAILSPPLSTKPSISSFHHITMSGELPQMSEEEEKWSDLLGHANFTIVPLPYKPDTMDLASFEQLRSDRDTARVNYAKHLARTGEHYGTTSKIYALTEEKWAETDSTWRANIDEVAELVLGRHAAAALPKFEEGICITVPCMDAEGKFPERGDEDIVGPMVREISMVSPHDTLDKKRNNFWHHLAGRVGIRR
ncbi:hypothetical protein BX600DRAFT_133595 [Xylariales sp. PMI_506]|nr:hypothetical protein BX600DRAFT_133595 [Xylariales sp. PMI_506]